MSGRRFTTVHDAAALRIHTDGSRVPVDGRVKGNKRAKLAIQDRRGNWIAQDAAGALGIKRRRVTVIVEEDAAMDDQASGLNESSNDAGCTDKGKCEAGVEDGEPSGPVPRNVKRQQFLADLSFLDSPSSHGPHVALGQSTTAEASSLVSAKDLTTANTFPNPSSDLLKRIHYMASRYYHEMGQLEDVTREMRKNQRRRRRIKLGLQNDPRNIRGDSIDNSSGEEEEGSDDNMGSTGELEEDVDEEEGEHGEEAGNVDLFGDRDAEQDTFSNQSEDEDIDQWKEKYADQDMYKIFDGSALLAIGMLMQEYVAEMMTTRLPAEEPERQWKRRR